MKDLKLFFVLILLTQLSLAQNRIVYGVVTDSIGIAIPGANILIEGTKTNTQTDFDGCFSIKVKSDQFLVFTSVGYFSQRVSVSKNDINVVLQRDYSLDHDCIVPSLLPVKKEKIRGAITTISAKDSKNTN